MIPKDKALKQIKIYMYVCKLYNENLQYYCQRYSNNSVPVFTDQEILTIYLFVGSELLTPIKAIKEVTEQKRQRNKAADDLYSTAGLLLHTIGKLAIAFIFLIFNY